MCLCINSERTKQHSLITTNKRLTFYKDFNIVEGPHAKLAELHGIQTPYRNYDISYTLDFIEVKDELDIAGTAIFGGAFHAHITKYQDCFCYSCFPRSRIRVPIIVYSDDVIAFSSTEVCFFKYRISKKVWVYIFDMVKKKLPDLIKIYGQPEQYYQ